MHEQPNRAATVIVHDVMVGREADYDAWAVRAVEAHQSAPGYVGADFVRPVGNGLRYVTIIWFEIAEYARGWLSSDARAGLVAEVAPFLVNGDRTQVRHNPDFWFVPEAAGVQAPRRAKQWLLTWIIVSPLTLVAPPVAAWLLGLVGAPVGGLLQNFLAAAMISSSMVYLLMPAAVRRLQRWLVR